MVSCSSIVVVPSFILMVSSCFFVVVPSSIKMIASINLYYIYSPISQIAIMLRHVENAQSTIYVFGPLGKKKNEEKEKS